MMNEYHQRFLKALAASRVRFLVIGGQARKVHFGKSTKDLDIWIEFNKENIAKFRQVFADWLVIFPNHHRPLQDPNFKIEFNTQIHLPDADVSIMKPDGEELCLSETNKIDILFSLDPAKGCPTFNCVFGRSIGFKNLGYEFRVMAEDDLKNRA